MDLNNQEGMFEIQKAVVSNMGKLEELVQECGYNPRNIRIEEKNYDDYEFIEIVIPHHQKKEYDITLTIDEEVTLFFYKFHTHHAMYDNNGIRLFDKEVKSLFKEIKLLLTSDIVITEVYRDSNEYRNVLEIIDFKGKKKKLGSVHYDLQDLKNYKKTNRVVTKINFRENS